MSIRALVETPRPDGKSPDEAHTPKTTNNMKTARLILDIIFEYALNKFDDSRERLEREADSFLSVIRRFVEAKTPVEACLPAFPFKSANKVYKVLGSLPDKAEELALERLNSMCIRIRSIYPPGAQVVIISDGITYNDLLCISDQDTWQYGEELRKMAVEKRFDNIIFSRINHLLDFPLPRKLREITYVANCTTFRHLLINKYGRDDIDIDKEIANNPDTKLTYLGYKRFLESDLKYIYPRGTDRTANDYRRDCKYLAKQMLVRGYAFARAVLNAFPNHLRLSIHESVEGNKVSMRLLNTRSGFTTPWHCSVAQLVDGEWISAPCGEFQKDSRLKLIYENGRPSYFKEVLREGESEPICENTANYLRTPSARRASEYFSADSTPRIASPAMISSAHSVLSGRAPNGQGDSMVTTPAISSFACSTTSEPGLSIDIDSKSSKASNFDPSTPYGRRLLPQIMDSLAEMEPDRVVFSLTSISNVSMAARQISAQTFANAVDKTAWWLHTRVGTPELIEPVGYIGPHDLRHILLTYACVKAGYAALFLSPKNNSEGALAVLEATKCNIWVKATEARPIPLVGDILQKRPMSALQLPSLDELLDDTRPKPFPYTKLFDEAKNDPFCFLHTSGTTGAPKPIPWSHGLIGTMDAVRLLPPVEGDEGLLPWTSDWKAGERIYSSFPMSHGAGVIMDILMPALFNLHCILGPVGVLPNVNLVGSLADYADIDIWSMVPSLVDEVGETPEVLAKLKSSKFICASGGPVSPVSAGKVNEVVRVLNLTGTTEGLFIGNLVPEKEDWLWFRFHPYSGFEFKEVEEGTFEHWVHRDDHWSLFQGIFHTFPEKQSINFKDLYRKHPVKKNLWAFTGRSDDLVVLSNGYKISPLDTEALITTHPDVQGCLIFGTGRPQAGLFIQLKESVKKTPKLLDSIWKKVQKANSMSRHRNQLLKDFVTFSDPANPFIRTDKQTVKRAATLGLYSDFIERFYSSRNDDLLDAVTVDVTSIESIQAFVREILSPGLLGINEASFDADLFDLGLDSLGVFAAIKIIRVATGLGDNIAPRHFYSTPSIGGLSETIARIVSEMSSTNVQRVSNKDQANREMRDAVSQHKARQPFKLNAFDYVNPNHGMGLAFYFPLHDGVSFDEVFDQLQQGLNRTFDMIPALSGKVMECSGQEIGHKKGDLCVTIPPLSMAGSAKNRLVYKDLANSLPSYGELRHSNFAPSAFKDSLVIRDDAFPKLPADIFTGQANFVKGGCILAVDVNHCCLDGLGVMIALKAWAENCRFLQGDESATCSWYDPESFNHSLPEIIHEKEGWPRQLDDIDPGTWNFLPFHPPEISTQTAPQTALPPRLDFPLHSVWPPPQAERCLKTSLFLITPEKLENLKQDGTVDPEAKGNSSISDILQAFFWRAAIRARYLVAKIIRKKTFSSDELSILELPTDGRPYFSSLLPSTYMGSMLILNRSSMSVETLCSPETSIGSVAHTIRQSAARVTPAVVHDAFTIMHSLPDHSRFSTANMGLEHMHAMISNLMLFPSSDICFGDKYFANRGEPESMRPQLERGNGRFRFLVIFPLRRDGGVELVLGTHPEELEMLKEDGEFTKYAELSDGGH